MLLVLKRKDPLLKALVTKQFKLLLLLRKASLHEIYSHRGSYVREFKLSHSNTVYRIITRSNRSFIEECVRYVCKLRRTGSSLGGKVYVVIAID